MTACHTQFIDHFGTTLQEPDRAEDFWRRVLGGTLLRKRDDQITITMGACPIALFPDRARGLPYRARNRGLPRFAFEVASDDFSALLERLRAENRAFDGPDESDGDDATHVWLHDTEGNYLEFVDRGAPKQHPEEAIEFVRIDRVEFEDLDLNRTERFYTEAMGFEATGRGLSPEGYPFLDLRIPTSGQIIRFHRVADPSVLLTEEFHGHHLALHLSPEGYEATCRALTEYGVLLDPEEHGTREVKIVENYFLDPGGHRLSLGISRGERVADLPKRGPGRGRG